MATASQTTLFPMEEAPEESEPKDVWGMIELYRKAQEKHGTLVPQNVAPRILGVSAARISELLGQGRFQSVKLYGQRFLTLDSIVKFAGEERKAGRPVKLKGGLPVVVGMAKEAVSWVDRK